MSGILIPLLFFAAWLPQFACGDLPKSASSTNTAIVEERILKPLEYPIYVPALHTHDPQLSKTKTPKESRDKKQPSNGKKPQSNDPTPELNIDDKHHAQNGRKQADPAAEERKRCEQEQAEEDLPLINACNLSESKDSTEVIHRLGKCSDEIKRRQPQLTKETNSPCEEAKRRVIHKDLMQGLTLLQALTPEVEKLSEANKEAWKLLLASVRELEKAVSRLAL